MSRLLYDQRIARRKRDQVEVVSRIAEEISRLCESAKYVGLEPSLSQAAFHARKLEQWLDDLAFCLETDRVETHPPLRASAS